MKTNSANRIQMTGAILKAVVVSNPAEMTESELGLKTNEGLERYFTS